VTAVDSEAAFLLTSVNYFPGIAAVAVDLNGVPAANVAVR